MQVLDNMAKVVANISEKDNSKITYIVGNNIPPETIAKIQASNSDKTIIVLNPEEAKEMFGVRKGFSDALEDISNTKENLLFKNKHTRLDLKAMEDSLIEFKYGNDTKAHREANIVSVRDTPKISRNKLCPCGRTDDTGKRLKYKNCCINKEK